ncbi:hypothetical protein [Neisseria dumasiana]|uniref:hypothetical protein n=1 Tax=Neisseria dumasiana TaxID=1931275 RepID=UPI000A195DDE|nr:hypothetical protein [Neisseria dumasiana]OSI17393.1 hypothetical protein BV914_01245 [Neisseria dumasiana]
MTKNDIEIFAIIALCILSVILFIWIPAHPVSSFDMELNAFVDRYLFGNGYYKPTRYPFTSKVVNGFSTAAFFITPFFFTFWNPRKKLYEDPSLKRILVFYIFGFIFLILLIRTSILPKEFLISTGRRGFGHTESFHNTPFLFMLFMLMKNFTIYACIRALGQLSFASYEMLKTHRLEKAWAKKQREWRDK